MMEARTGAGGLVGAQALLLCNIACIANQFLVPESDRNPQSAFTPVIAIGCVPDVVVVGPSVQSNTLRDFIDRARSSLRNLSFATAGPGSTSSLTAELLATKASIQIMEIPYRGSSAASPDLVSGRVDAMVMGLLESLSLVRSGKVRALGLTSLERARSLPDVPTIAEAGVPGYHFVGWLSLFAPKGTPSEIVDDLNAGFNKALVSPAVLARFSEQSIKSIGGPPNLAGRLLNEDVELWGPILSKENGRR
jgi:tripartite-type tricarboxylate transporter receptor subunit TctC